MALHVGWLVVGEVSFLTIDMKLPKWANGLSSKWRTCQRTSTKSWIGKQFRRWRWSIYSAPVLKFLSRKCGNVTSGLQNFWKCISTTGRSLAYDFLLHTPLPLPLLSTGIPHIFILCIMFLIYFCRPSHLLFSSTIDEEDVACGCRCFSWRSWRSHQQWHPQSPW